VKGGCQFDAICVDGADVLRPKGEESCNDEEWELYCRRIVPDLEEQRSQELVVPSRSLELPHGTRAAAAELKVPLRYTVRKT